jgi:hypothetical protein
MKIAQLRAQKETLDFGGRYRIAKEIDKLNDYIKL